MPEVCYGLVTFQRANGKSAFVWVYCGSSPACVTAVCESRDDWLLSAPNALRRIPAIVVLGARWRYFVCLGEL